MNEPLHDPPDRPGEGGGNYIEALGGRGATGWDWVRNAFRMAREYFPHAQLLLNDYDITNDPGATQRYKKLIELLQAERLIDAIGVQGHAFSTRAEVPMTTHVASLDSLAATGLPIYVTELDVDVLPRATQNRTADVGVTAQQSPSASVNPFTAGLPDSVQQALSRRYADLFAVFLKHRLRRALGLGET